jgi:hypothetical protein
MAKSSVVIAIKEEEEIHLYLTSNTKVKEIY